MPEAREAEKLPVRGVSALWRKDEAVTRYVVSYDGSAPGVMSRDVRGSGRLVLGSASSGVVNHADCDVLVVKGPRS